MRNLLLAACVASLSAASLVSPASAFPAASMPAAAPAAPGIESTVTKIDYRYCRAWRRECAARWGWHGWRFERCVRIHGC